METIGSQSKNGVVKAQLHWVKAHQTRQAVDEGRVTLENFQGNQEADEVANSGAAAHVVHEPTAEYLRWEVVAQAVRNFWLMVAPKLGSRPEDSTSSG
eukprot:1237872-Amphidinium_carterae.1